MSPLEQSYWELGTQVLYAGLTKGLGVDEFSKGLQEIVPLISEGQSGLKDAISRDDQVAAASLRGAVKDLESQRDKYLIEIGKAAYAVRRGTPQSLKKVDRWVSATATANRRGVWKWAASSAAIIILGGMGVWASGMFSAPATEVGEQEVSTSAAASTPHQAEATSLQTDMADQPHSLPPNQASSSDPAFGADGTSAANELLRFIEPPRAQAVLQSGLFAGVLQESAERENVRGAPPPLIEAAQGDLVLTVVGRYGRVWDISQGRAVSAFEISGPFWHTVRVGLSSDGQTLVALRGNLVKGQGNATIRGYDPRTGQLRWRQEGDAESLPIIGGRVFGNRLVTSLTGGRGVKAWNLADGAPIPLPETSAQLPQDVRIAPDCPLLVLRRPNGSEWELIDFRTGRLVHVLRTTTFYGLSADGSLAVTDVQEQGGLYEGVHGLDLTGETPKAVWKVMGQRVQSVVPELGCILFLGGQEQKLGVYDIASGNVENVWFAGSGVGQVSATKDGRLLLAQEKLLDRATGALRAMFPVGGLSVLSSSDRIVTLEPDGRVAVWNSALVGENVLRQANAVWNSTNSFNRIAQSNNGERLAAVNQHGQLQVFNIANSQPLPLQTLVNENYSAPRFVFGDLRIVGQQRIPVGNGSLMQWDVLTGQPQTDVFPLVATSRDIIHYLALSSDGQTLAARVSDDPAKLRFISASTGAAIGELDCPQLRIDVGMFSEDGRYFGVPQSNGIAVYDVAALKPIAKLDFSQLDPSGPDSSVCTMSPDGQTVWRSFDVPKAAGIDPNLTHRSFATVEVWNVESLAKQQTLYVGAPVHQLLFLSDGEHVASRSEGDVSIRLWNRSTGALQRLLVGHTGSIQALDYHPGNNRIVSISNDQTFRFWELNAPVVWDSESVPSPVNLADAVPNRSLPGGGNPLGLGMDRPNTKIPPRSPVNSGFTPEQIAGRQALADQLSEGVQLRGEWSFAKFDGRIVFRITKAPDDQQQFTLEAFDPAKSRDTKAYSGRMEFDRELKTWALEWTGIVESGLRRNPSRVPTTTNLLLLGDQRVIRLREINGEWRGQDSTGVTYVLKLVKAPAP